MRTHSKGITVRALTAVGASANIRAMVFIHAMASEEDPREAMRRLNDRHPRMRRFVALKSPPWKPVLAGEEKSERDRGRRVLRPLRAERRIHEIRHHGIHV